jgi:hypothetical protein
VISARTDLAKRRLALEHVTGRNRGAIDFPSPSYTIKWHIEGEPQAESATPSGVLSDAPYRELAGGINIDRANLHATWSGLCLAGRVAGEATTRQVIGSVRFQSSIGAHGLEALLTIHGWSANGVSRMTFFNARTEQLDRGTTSPTLIVADGDACFLKVLGRSDFQRSDVLGVIHRAMERDRLEAVGNRLVGLRQWYADDAELLNALPPPPRGISLSILVKRST